MAQGQGLIQKTTANGHAASWVVNGDVQSVENGLTLAQAFDSIKAKAAALAGTVVRVQVVVNSKEA